MDKIKFECGCLVHAPCGDYLWLKKTENGTLKIATHLNEGGEAVGAEEETDAVIELNRSQVIELIIDLAQMIK